MSAPMIIRPQPGQQTKFLSSSADIVFYGGAAGGGKSYGLLLDAMRHMGSAKGYGAVIFRKTSPQIRQEGGLWDTSKKIYPYAGAKSLETLEWRFPPHNNRVKFNHLEHERDLQDHTGGQYPFVGFDEVTHFPARWFFWLLSRNRSPCGIRPVMRCTCNPDSQSWVAKFISWWIDPNTGYPIPERDGAVRWFKRSGDDIVWADRMEDLPQVIDDNGATVRPKSVAFIRSNVYDNPALLNADPEYVGTLMSMPLVEREQLLKGNWKIARAQGTFFRRHSFAVVDAHPPKDKDVWYWDRAATEPKGDDDPDWTVGVHLRRTPSLQYCVMNVVRLRGTPAKVESAIKAIASQHVGVSQHLEQDPGSAGVAEISYLVRALAGFHVVANKVSQDKVTRALPVVSQVEHGNVSIMRAAWNEAFLSELEAFGPDPKEYAHDDQVDAFSGAFNALARPSQPRVRSL